MIKEMDPDPDSGGPKTCGTCGSESPTPKKCHAISGKNLPRMTMKGKKVEKWF
jgi:hypothetical protein